MSAGLTIVVADADFERRQAKCEVLRGAGWTVIPTSSSEGAIDHVGGETVGLLVLDAALSYRNGGDLCRTIKDKHPEILILQTFGQGESAQAGCADSYLWATCEPAILVAACKTLLRLREAEVALDDSDARLKLAQDAADVALVDWDFRTNVAIWSPKLNEIFGVDKAIVDAAPAVHDLLQRIHSEDRDRIAAAYLDLSQRGGQFEDDFRVTWRDGRTHWIAVRGEFIVGRGRVPERMMGVVFDITARKQEEETNAMLAAVVTSSADAILSMDLASRIVSMNAAAEKLFGYTAQEAIGKPADILIPAQKHKEREELISRLRLGESVECQTVRLGKGAKPIHVWLSASPIWSRTRKLIGYSGIYRDITEVRRREDQILSLLRELAHRSKNLMAVIQSMARHSLSSTPSPEDFVAKFIERLVGLAASHDLLAADDWRGASLNALLRLQLDKHADWLGKRILFEGPEIILLPAAAQTIGMALHELHANAFKYGALSIEPGSVHINWWVRSRNELNDRFEMEWLERGGPAVAPPSVTGFGHTVVGRVTGQALGGISALEYADSGIRWTLEAPTKAIIRVPDEPERALAHAGRPMFR